VSTRGIIPLSFSLDHAGPITRSVEDAAIVLDAIAGTSDGANYRESLTTGIHDFVVGVPRKYFYEDLDGEIGSAVGRAIDRLGKLAKSVRVVECPIDEDRTVFLAESHAYHRDKIASSPELYDPETLRRVRMGDKLTEAEYQTAKVELQLVRQEIAKTFCDVDVLVTPTTPVPAPRISELLKDISLLRPAEIRLLRNTRPVNVWGLPAISVPCGFTSEGLPIGVQIIGALNGEKKVLQAAYAYEQVLSDPS
jgi:Asp-tRNA(Asn)/Glu-tRNA(Gln) amidotransferase A subunit family amidase